MKSGHFVSRRIGDSVGRAGFSEARNRTTRVVAWIAGLLLLGSGICAHAQETRIRFHIAPQELSSALSEFGAQAHVGVGAPESATRGLATSGVDGDFTPAEALSRLLVGTNLQFRFVHPDTVQIFPGGAAEGGTQPVELGRVLVTASRRQEMLQDVPMSVSVVNPDQFATGGLKTLEDVAEYTPGVNFSGGVAPGFQTITMRGVSQTLVTPTVGIYLDDIPLGGGGQFGGASGQEPDLVSTGLERIELVKGPQGTLYGATAMGGVVRYITSDPSLDDTVHGGLLTDGSNTKGGSSNILYRGWGSIPLVKDRLGIRLAGFFNDLGGFVDRDAGSVSGPGLNVNGGRIRGGTAKMVGHLTDDLTGSLMYLRSDTQFRGLNSVDLQGPPFEPIVGKFKSLQSDQPGFTSFQVVGGTLQYDFPWASLLSSSSYQDVKFGSRQDLTVPLGPLIELIAGTGPGSVTSAPFTAFVRTQRAVQEFRLTSKRFFDDRLEWIAGAFVSHEKSTNKQALSGQPIDFTLLDVNFPSKQNQGALYGDLTWFFTPKFDATVGTRLSITHTNVFLADSVQLLVQNLPLTRDKKTNETYMFNVRYRPFENLSLYSRVASGFRPESANLPVLDASGQPAVPPIIKQDRLWSFEGGFKGNLLDGLVAYDFAGWHLIWRDLQAIVNVRGVGTGGNANSDVQASGLEATLGVHPAWWVALNTNFAFTHSVLKDDETAAFGALAGERMPGLPRWTVAENADFNFPLINNWRGFFGAGVRFVGKQNTGFNGGTGKDGSAITPLVVNFPLKSYALADVRAGVAVGNVKLSFYGTNLFDKFAFRDGSAVPVVQGLFATAQVVQPRTLGGVLSVEF